MFKLNLLYCTDMAWDPAQKPVFKHHCKYLVHAIVYIYHITLLFTSSAQQSIAIGKKRYKSEVSGKKIISEWKRAGTPC